jgi:serine/threonine-protein kinase
VALAPGTRLGAYEILTLIGSGGMGEVYRARDLTLNRDVALKTLPGDFALDPERMARFKREAQVLASLNHSNIAAIYGFEESEGVQALVLELVEGQTLADRIAQGPIPVEEVLPIAKQIAEALEEAHGRGIIHRDLKPANIKLTPDGKVKVLDFGLAKLLDPQAVGGAGRYNPGLANSPTITTPAMTMAGVILGTAAYMSPEQAKGHEADKRSDVWAFGCVLYEMLSGKRAFEGEDVSDTLANILKADVDWTALPRELPPAIGLLLRRCLERNRASRVADLSIARFVLTEPSLAEPRSPSTSRGRVRIASALLATAFIGAIVGRTLRQPAAVQRPSITRFTVTLGRQDQFTATGRQILAVSPDGRRLVYGANGQLYLRSFDQLEATPIRGTGGGDDASYARNPFFSPDGGWVGFWQNGKLKKVQIDGGLPVDICEAGNPYGATWAENDTILFGAGVRGIYRVEAAGGQPALIVRDPGGTAHGPQLLPGGHAVLFTLAQENKPWDEARIVVQSLETGRREVLVSGGTDGRYLGTGHLVYVTGGTLVAAPFDVASLKVSGAPIALVERIAQAPVQTGAAHFSLSRSGTLVYIPGSFRQTLLQSLVWLDRHGRETPLNAPIRVYLYPRISPDGRRIALVIRGEGQDIWMWDTERASLERFTDGRTFSSPVWSPDGRRLLFGDSAGGSTIWSQSADGSGVAEQLTQSTGTGQAPSSFTPDGTKLVFYEPYSGGLSVLTVRPERRVSPLLRKPGAVMRNADIYPPDGRWIAYESTESGASQIFVRPFPNVDGGRWQVSTDGGRAPVWSRDGRELFYVPATGGLMAVSVTPGTTLTFSTPTRVVNGSYLGMLSGLIGRMYDVSPRGDRFLVMKSAADQQPQSVPDSIVVAQNWIEELKARVPTK